MPQRKAREKEMTVTVTRHYKLVEKVCPGCGKTFWGPKVRVYCSSRGACASRANYQRHAPERRAERLRKYYQQKEQP